ncbi:hypothetical protein PG993_000658 [Apiospora rasikravindrae]|uniref:Uncharacterized protein n=1 Tax=Apiospora rasikravindrae TaxID=990691 RepID=A0ABR1UB94_9PEZI
MDPFSGVTALIPIALMLLKAGHELKVFIRALHTAPEDVHHFMDEMISYSIFLRNFHRTVHESGYNLESDEEGERRELVMHVVKQAGIVMKGVKEDIFPIFEAVHAEANPSSTSFMTRLKWCSKKSEIANLRRCLSEAKSSAQLLLSMFTYDLNRRNCEVLQTILRPNQLPRSLTTQRVTPDIRPRPQIDSSAADLLPVNTGHTPITNWANKSDPTKRSTRNQILGWLGVQKELKEKGEAEESGHSDGVAGYQSIDRPRDSSPAPSMSTSSSLESAPPNEDGARQRPGGRIRRVPKQRDEDNVGQIGCKSGSGRAAFAAAAPLALPTKTASGSQQDQ